ncbi:MAG: glycosyltransferase [Actinomycetaceae bacterium]|nr:glycosyltransferase [Actinomycetaceae bacterium]
MSISVIVPYYNSSAHLPGLIHTLTELTVHTPDTQVVIVDDCSNHDEYIKLCEATANFDWTVVRQETNTGPGPARNRGITLATGDYIVFLDADDSLSCDMYRVLSPIIREHDPDVILFDVKTVSPRSTLLLRMIPDSERGRVDPKFALAYARSMTAGKCYKSRFIRDFNLAFGDLKRHEDTAFTKSALGLAQSVFYEPQALYVYQITPGSLVTDESNASMESSFNSIAYIRDTVGDRRPEEVQYVYIVEVILSCAMKINSLGLSDNEVKTLFDRFDVDEPHWWDNGYLKHSSRRYQLMAQMVRYRRIRTLRLFLRLEAVARKLLGIG